MANLVDSTLEQQPKGFSTIKATEENLATIERWAPNMLWDLDNPEPASNILDARLRAKYYGARVITYRPHIIRIMRLSSHTEQEASADIGRSDEYKDSVNAPNINPNAKSLEEIDPVVVGWAKKGLRALVHSTEAFHRVANPAKERLIVTNVWGTAMA
jgi:hypothetical protein